MPATAMTWAVAAPLAAFVVYRRMRRSFGREPLHAGRFASRSLFLSVVVIAGLARHDDLNGVGTTSQ